jgi:hypothetical protein
VRSLSVAFRVTRAVELATGVALLVAPDVVLDALIGSSPTAAAPVGRVLGGALLGLGAAGVLSDNAAPGRAVASAFLVYNASAAAILATAGVTGSAEGGVLWPVVIIHAILVIPLVGLAAQRGEKRRIFE